MANPETACLRLQQTTHHLLGTPPVISGNLSIVHGPSEPALINLTLGELLDEQCEIRGDRECLIVPWTGARWTFADLQEHSKKLAKAMLALGLRAGDRVGILAGNCEEYVAVFFAAGYLGCILMVLTSTYTADEAQFALKHSGESLALNHHIIPALTLSLRMQGFVRRRKIRPSRQYPAVARNRSKSSG